MQGLTGPGWQAAAWSAGAMTVIVALRYLVTSGTFAWATGKVRPGLYQGLAVTLVLQGGAHRRTGRERRQEIGITATQALNQP